MDGCMHYLSRHQQERWVISYGYGLGWWWMKWHWWNVFYSHGWYWGTQVKPHSRAYYKLRRSYCQLTCARCRSQTWSLVWWRLDWKWEQEFEGRVTGLDHLQHLIERLFPLRRITLVKPFSSVYLLLKVSQQATHLSPIPTRFSLLLSFVCDHSHIHHHAYINTMFWFTHFLSAFDSWHIQSPTWSECHGGWTLCEWFKYEYG